MQNAAPSPGDQEFDEHVALEIARTVATSVEDADLRADCTQEVLLHLWLNWDKVRKSAAWSQGVAAGLSPGQIARSQGVRAFLFVMAKHRLRSYLRWNRARTGHEIPESRTRPGNDSDAAQPLEPEDEDDVTGETVLTRREDLAGMQAPLKAEWPDLQENDRKVLSFIYWTYSEVDHGRHEDVALAAHLFPNRMGPLSRWESSEERLDWVRNNPEANKAYQTARKRRSDAVMRLEGRLVLRHNRVLNDELNRIPPDEMPALERSAVRLYLQMPELGDRRHLIETVAWVLFPDEVDGPDATDTTKRHARRSAAQHLELGKQRLYDSFERRHGRPFYYQAS